MELLIVGQRKMVNSILDKLDLFDYTTGYDTEPDVQIDNSLSDWIIAEGIRYYNLFRTPPSGLCGVAALSGAVGNGKDLLGNYLSWINYKVFPHKRLLRNEKPRELFGLYDGLFNETVLDEELSKMRTLASDKKVTIKERSLLLEQAADNWISSEGQVLLKNSILYLTEYWRYCYKRDPFNPMNKTMGGIHKVKRHFDIFIIGTIQLMTDLDRFTCLPFLDWEIKCRRSAVNPTGFIYMVFKLEYQGERRGIVRSISPIDIIKLDGAKPITELGEPITIIGEPRHNDRYEKKVLDSIKSGVVTLEDLQKEVKFRNSNTSVLKILKKLFADKTITYGCWFNIYNSKSPTQL